MATSSTENPVQGTPGDVAELFRMYRAPMIRMAYVLTNDSAIAEEIVQDAFLKVHASWPRLDNPAGYLRTTVVNGCYSFHRRRAIEQRHAPRVVDSSFQIPDELGDALAKLGDRQRVVLALRYYCDLPDAEIARAIGARPSTVRSLIRRALIALHKELEQ